MRLEDLYYILYCLLEQQGATYEDTISHVQGKQKGEVESPTY